MSGIPKNKTDPGIKVVYKRQTWFLAVRQGILSFDALKKCFPTATSLYYLKDTGDEVVNEILTVNNDVLNIPDLTQTYYPYIPQGYENVMNMKKTVRVENMIKSLNDAKLLKNKNFDNGAKASIESANNNVKKSSEEDIKFKNEKEATITWKHRESEKSIFKPNSAFHYKDKISLSATKDYSVRELTKESVNIFSTPTTKWFFDNCTINIGIGSDKIVTRFSGKDGSSCRFWEYCRLYRDNGGRLTIYLLTTSNSLQLLLTDLSVINTINDASKNANLKRQLPDEHLGTYATVKSCKENKDESIQREKKSSRKKFQDKTSFEMNYPSIKFSSASTSPKPSSGVGLM